MSFSVGDRVVHPMWDEGTVEEVTDDKVFVRWDKNWRKGERGEFDKRLPGALRLITSPSG